MKRASFLSLVFNYNFNLLFDVLQVLRGSNGRKKKKGSYHTLTIYDSITQAASPPSRSFVLTKYLYYSKRSRTLVQKHRFLLSFQSSPSLAHLTFSILLGSLSLCRRRCKLFFGLWNYFEKSIQPHLGTGFQALL